MELQFAQYYPPYINQKPELTIETIHLIQDSWRIVQNGSYTGFLQQTLTDDPKVFWGLNFYEELFKLEPKLKPLFLDIAKQAEMLASVLDSTISLLSHCEQGRLVSVLQELAQRHVRYQTKVEHYSFVGLALITTHSKILASAFDQQTKASWLELYSFICTVMIPEQIKLSAATVVLLPQL